jgi:phage tail sheath protein FI
MASLDPVFGIVIHRIDDEVRPPIFGDLSTVGLAGPAKDADPLIFPLNVPVKFFSNESKYVLALGASGFLQDAVRGVNDQLGELQRAAEIVVVRTAEGTNADATLKAQETMANIMGNSSLGTGIFAFIAASELVGSTPRLLSAPGYTSQLATGVDALTATTMGVGYVPNKTYTLTFTGGGSGAVQATGHAVANDAGEIRTSGLVIDTPGQWYTATPTVAVNAAGDSPTTPAVVTATTATLANPVCASFPTVCRMLLAHAVVESAGTSQASDEAWRETLNSDRLIPISGGCKVIDAVTGFVVTKPFAPRVVGIGVRRDFEKGAPFHSWANQPVNGIVGPSRSLKFDILTGTNEGQALLEANIGILVRGEIGSDFAISSGGYEFIGTDNAGDDPLWQFYNVTRGRDFIHIMMVRSLRIYLGRQNITRQTIQAVLNTMTDGLTDLYADGHILGFRVGFKSAQNSASEIRLGHLTVNFRAEEPPVLRKITIDSGRYRPAIDAMVAALEAQLNSSV